MSGEVKAKKSKKNEPKVIVPEPVIVKDKQYFIKKCEEFAEQAQGKVTAKIMSGQLNIRETPLHIEFEDKEEDKINENPDKDIREKISSLNQDLQSLQQEIIRQKEEEKKREQIRKHEAKTLIQRLKKEKEEHRNRIKFNQINQRLKDSAFSDDVLKMMKEHRQKIIHDKKKDMQLKIYHNVNRRVVREEENIKNQISYWSKVKEIQGKRRYHSTKILPQIRNNSHMNQQEFGVNISHKNLVIPRKNSNIKKRSKSKQDILDYQEVVTRFLERAKAKQQSQSQKSPRVNAKSRIFKNEAIDERVENEQNHHNLSRVTASPRNEKIDQIMASQADNKRKILGDEYLKESLLRVKSPRINKKGDESRAEQSLQLKGNAAIFSRNDRLAQLEDRRNKLLDSLIKGRIEKPLAIQMLHPVENTLDRIDPAGIDHRLKEKLLIFQRHQKLNQKVGVGHDQQDAWQESSEHGI